MNTLTAEEQENAEWKKLQAPINPIKRAHDHGDNVPLEQYIAQDDGVKRGDPDYVMSRGELMEFDRCPHRWLNGYLDDKSNSTEWGSLLDALVLIDTYDKYFAVCPETYPAPAHHAKVKKGEIEEGDPLPWNNNATYCDEWCREQAGKQIVKADTFKGAVEAVKLLFADQQIADLIHASRHQVMITGSFYDEDTGLTLPLKGLIDLVPAVDSPFGGCLADLKTCASAAQRAWTNAVYEHRYHWQSALYLDLWNAAHQEYRQEFRHILQESYAPWQTAKRLLSVEYISVGRAQYVAALKRYAACLKSGDWDDYDVARTNADLVIDGWSMTQPIDWMILAS